MFGPGASGVLRATSADPWSASFMVETRTLFVFHKSKNFNSDYEIRMPPTACFEHSNFFKVTAPEARPSQLRPGAYRRQKRQADRCSPKVERATHPKYTQDVRVCPSAHTRRTWLYVCVRVCPSAHTGRPWLSVCVRQHTQDVRGFPSVHISARCTHRTSVGVRQHTQDVRGCTCVSVRVRLCPSAHTGRPWLSISTHISTLVLGLSTLALPVDCLDDFGPRGQSVQYTQDVRGCPWLSMCVRQHTQDVSGCPSVHISAPWSLDSVHWPFSWTVRVILAHVGCLFRTHMTSVSVRQHTHDIRGCLSAHTRRPWQSVCVRVCPSAHTRRLWLSISTHISTLVLGLSMLTLPVDCLGDFGPRGLSVKYTQDVRVCPSAHKGRPWLSVGVRQHTQDVRGCPSAHTRLLWLSVCVRQHTQDVCGCPSVHISACCTHRMSVGVLQHTQDVTGCQFVFVCVRLCPSAHTGRPWLSISTHISMLVLGLNTLTLPVDCLGDFGPRGLSVKYTQDVRVCPSAHKGHPLLSVGVRQHTHDVRGCPTHRMSVGVLQHTQDVTGCQFVFVCVRLCPSAHTGRPWLSISTHISMLVLGLNTLALAVDCLGDFGPRGLSVQYTQDVRGCPSAHTRRMWLTHRTSVGVRQHTQDVRGCTCVSVRVRLCPSAHTGRLWLSISTHISALVLGLSMLALPVDCLGDFGPRGQSVQYTQDVRGCLWLSVCVRVCPSAYTRRPWLSISAHISTLVLGLSMLALPVDCSSDFGPRGLSVQYTQDIRGTHISTLVLGLSTLTLPVDCLVDFGPCGLSVKYTQDVYGCPSAHTRRPCVSVSTHMTSVAVRGCPSAHTGRPWVSVSTHKTYVAVRVCPTLTLPVHCSGDFSPRGLSVQYTQDVYGCPPAHTRPPWLSVCVRVCPCVSVSTHRTSVAVHQYTYQHVGPWTQHADPSRGLFGTHMTSVAVHQYTYQHVGPSTQHAGPSGGLFGTSVAVCGCPSAHIGRSWLFVAVRVCPCVSVSTHRTSVVVHQLSVQYAQNVRGCPSAHTGRPCVLQHTQDVHGCPCVSVSPHRTSVAVRQYTYQHVGPWTQHADPSRGLFGTHRTSVAVHQYTYQHVGPWTQHAGPSHGLFG
ncbi:hypothetical protein YC2023_066329 [Brassica napus]